MSRQVFRFRKYWGVTIFRHLYTEYFDLNLGVPSLTLVTIELTNLLACIDHLEVLGSCVAKRR